MLRGVWGAALYEVDRAVYDEVFKPPQGVVPGYLLRPVLGERPAEPAIDWILFGSAVDRDATLRRAWEKATSYGLGSARLPFGIRGWIDLGPTGRPAEGLGPWRLDRARWPIDPDAPCRLVFYTPLRLLRDGKLIAHPTLVDLAVAAWRRLAAFLPDEDQTPWRALQALLLASARARPSRWLGYPLNLHRYSGSQETELDLRGVGGVLLLPEGVGPLAPLLVAAAWLHVGKGTVFGLGHFRCEDLTPE
ncbi:MAG: CRISPR system precrRNA processing endoribonuclease RAMP protein Cas6 [Gemmataceae bacterium]|nr:CRISPR system precrRNA processing endoribonuclease RAMP protein Cas6 [Gemmataceae bacterium]MDW8265895.1 CRISPR system precrRNA processing endoribonuclease RAMP protein Cas6 [Gemmataceae bacterium]